MRRTVSLEIFQPRSVKEAGEIIRGRGPGGHFLAGGTDIVIAIKEKGLVPNYLVDLKRIPSLTEIRGQPDGELSIGALTTMREIETSSIIRERYPFLSQSAAEVGSIQIRIVGAFNSTSSAIIWFVDLWQMGTMFLGSNPEPPRTFASRCPRAIIGSCFATLRFLIQPGGK